MLGFIQAKGKQFHILRRKYRQKQKKETSEIVFYYFSIDMKACVVVVSRLLIGHEILKRLSFVERVEDQVVGFKKYQVSSIEY